MSDLLKELLTLVEGDVKYLDDAAQHFEDFASQLTDGEKSEWQLLAAVYRERAQLKQIALEKVRQSFATDAV